MPHTDRGFGRESTLSTQVMDGVAVVWIAGPSVREQSIPAVCRHLSDIAEEHSGRLAIDMSATSRFTCAWINVLVALTNRCRELDGKLVIWGLDQRSLGLFRDTGLDKRLNIARDRSAALAELGTVRVAAWKQFVSRVASIPVARFGRPAAA